MTSDTSPLGEAGEHRVRLTEREAQLNLRAVLEFTDFLALRTDHELPGALETLVGDVTRRAGQLTDLGHVRVVECADATLAALIARDRTLRGLCRPLGERHLAIPPEAELKFRTALRKLGYVLPVASLDEVVGQAGRTPAWRGSA